MCWQNSALQKIRGTVILSAKPQMPHFGQKVRREESSAWRKDYSHGDSGLEKANMRFCAQKDGLFSVFVQR